MRLLGRNKLLKTKKKNLGNTKLCNEIDKLISDLVSFNPSEHDLKTTRPDADCVHNEGFYFFDINIHRVLILIELDEEGEATVVWVGTHQEYEATFKNNKDSIEKWLKKKGHI